MKKTRILIASIIFLCITCATAYLAIGRHIVQTATAVNPTCGGKLSNLPEKFHSIYNNENTNHDLSAWWFKDYEKITIDTQDNNIKLDAWSKQGKENSPWVILIHGVGSCKNDQSVLIPAGMLVKAGFSVLLIDLREHGLSSKIENRHSAGQTEWHDIISAWNWVKTNKNIPANKIGLYGVSFGAGTLIYASEAESNIQAIWLDYSFADMNKIVRSEIIRAGFPGWLAHAAKISGIIFYGIDVMEKSPLESIKHIGAKYVFITYSEHDQRTPKIHGDLLCKQAKLSVTPNSSVTCCKTSETLY